MTIRKQFMNEQSQNGKEGEKRLKNGLKIAEFQENARRVMFLRLTEKIGAAHKATNSPGFPRELLLFHDESPKVSPMGGDTKLKSVSNFVPPSLKGKGDRGKGL